MITQNPSTPKKSLRKRGNKTDLDEETYDSLSSSQASICIAKCNVLREEASSMKTAHTEYQGLIPAEMRRNEMSIKQIKPHKAKDNDQISYDTTYRLISIASEQIEKPGKEPCPKFLQPVLERFSALYHLQP